MTLLAYHRGDVAAWEMALAEAEEEMAEYEVPWDRAFHAEGYSHLLDMRHAEAFELDRAIEDERLADRLRAAQERFEAARNYALSLFRANDLPYPALAPVGVALSRAAAVLDALVAEARAEPEPVPVLDPAAFEWRR